ncbi:putative N-acetylmannosamine-6-phosphate 2-epimerase [bacterium]|nr:putative N-acetylmannosamine-6-phosphate 2-epimerase [bacterium]
MSIPTPSDREQQIASFVERVRHRLIVSCQALPHEPLHGAWIMARMAVAAAEGGAAAIRANGPEDIRAIRQAVDLPIIGLFKDNVPGYEVYITPSMEHVRAIVAAGTDIVAIDATARPRPQPGTLADFIAAIHDETGCPVLADISTFEEGIAAEEAGADLISTTMSGYTDYSPQQRRPDLDLVGQLAARLRVPVLAEGRYRTPEQVRAALDSGALAAIVGGAITRPQEITRWFVEGIATRE